MLLPACATGSNTNHELRTTNYPAAATALPEGFSYPAGDRLRVATWNAEHFVDSYDNPYIDAGREDDPPDSMRARRERFAEVVRRLDADVLVLQEFESAAYAERLAEERFPEMGYEFFAATESRDWYMNVVLMSRVPLGVVESYASVTTPIPGQTTDEGEPATQNFTNNRLWTTDVLARPGYTFTLAGLHLKAGPDERDAAWRTGQIRFLRSQLTDLIHARPKANVLVAGDLNSLPGSPELELLLSGEDGDDGPRLINPLAGRETLTHPAGNRQRQHRVTPPHSLPPPSPSPSSSSNPRRTSTPACGAAWTPTPKRPKTTRTSSSSPNSPSRPSTRSAKPAPTPSASPSPSPARPPRRSKKPPGSTARRSC